MLRRSGRGLSNGNGEVLSQVVVVEVDSTRTSSDEVGASRQLQFPRRTA